MGAPAASGISADAYGVAAGLDLLSGVFGFLASMNASSAAQSRADLIRMESEANAQRYSEQAAQFEAHTKMMYLSSGVKVSGSPIDALATEARVAHENVMSIRASGEAEALNAENKGIDAEMQGRNALLEGMKGATGFATKAAEVWPGASPSGGGFSGSFTPGPSFGSGTQMFPGMWGG